MIAVSGEDSPPNRSLIDGFHGHFQPLARNVDLVYPRNWTSDSAKVARELCVGQKGVWGKERERTDAVEALC